MKKFSILLLCSSICLGNHSPLQAMMCEGEAYLPDDKSKYSSYKFFPLNKKWKAHSFEENNTQKIKDVLE